MRPAYRIISSNAKSVLVPTAVKLVQIYWFRAEQKAAVYTALPNQCSPVYSDEKQPHKDKSGDDTYLPLLSSHEDETCFISVSGIILSDVFLLLVSSYPLHFIIRQNFSSTQNAMAESLQYQQG